MVSFRFHIVSIVAVFLALALGIGMGATVIGTGTSDFLKGRLDDVQSQVAAANQRSDTLQRQIDRDVQYIQIAEDYIVRDALAGVPVTIIAFRGFDEGPAGATVRLLQKAGANYQGTLWITGKAGLAEAGDATSLQRILSVPSTEPTGLRQAFLTRLSAVMAGANPPDALQVLIENGFLDWDAGGAGKPLAQAVFAQSRLVEMSSIHATVPNDQLALPLARLLAAQPTRRLVVAEIGREPDPKSLGERALFLGTLRNDPALTAKLSTVDHLELPQGRVAVALALAQLPVGRTGDYGYGQSTEGVLPTLRP